ncbi:hypothetical protein CHLRE_16g659900v5 [Chlamydomonas reinhardtii]|uniref:Uncharacterized protein n=1 Tax=Chlamydomonas reinhardtii TaxID=3055 RepID=A8J8M4_CHLRE|nr:uncharacterized protein CHLRE_16g659900v5 [Chlamydomonas reinhardtii]PNW71575.1 hypothetical protein CHLRE_16g659900v5 [Chlamydomonas reinhardtii]|eukprot:XP_001697927.1 hypothetical protein CHLREDRAFT_193064 [Chlamydomonas reinhardtii]
MFQVHALSRTAGARPLTRPVQLKCNTKSFTIRRAPLQVHATQGASASSKPAKDPAEVRSDLIKGCKTVMMELQGLDFPRNDVKGYFKFVVKPPVGVAKDFDLSRARVVVDQLMTGQEADINDVEGLKAAQLILSDVWRWRRRGGGMDDETDRPNYAIALESLQNMEPEQIDRITSSLLDNLPITEAEKRQMSGSVQQVAMAGINGAVWGSLAACLLFLLIFNFARGG